LEIQLFEPISWVTPYDIDFTVTIAFYYASNMRAYY
jgi:hypothetical protein